MNLCFDAPTTMKEQQYDENKELHFTAYLHQPFSGALFDKKGISSLSAKSKALLMHLSTSMYMNSPVLPSVKILY